MYIYMLTCYNKNRKQLFIMTLAHGDLVCVCVIDMTIFYITSIHTNTRI